MYFYMCRTSGNRFCVGSLAATDFESAAFRVCSSTKPWKFETTKMSNDECVWKWANENIRMRCDGVKQRGNFLTNWFIIHFAGEISWRGKSRMVESAFVQRNKSLSWTRRTRSIARRTWSRRLVRITGGEFNAPFSILRSEINLFFRLFFSTGMRSNQQRASSCIAYHSRSEIACIARRSAMSFIVANKPHGTWRHLFERTRRLAAHTPQAVRQFGEQSFPIVRFGARFERLQRKQLHDEHFNESLGTSQNSAEQ